VLLACAALSILDTSFRFLSTQNLIIMQRAIPTLGITALGVGLLMIAGEFDLSIGAVFGVSSYTMVLVFSWGQPILVGVAAALIVAAIIGLINGWITTTFNIPSFITTLGTLFIFRSGGRLISQNKPLIFTPPDWFAAATTQRIGGLIQVQFLWFIALAILAWAILNRHTLGNQFFAVGGNAQAAQKVGINVKRVKIYAFVICSLAAAIAGMISVTRVGSATTDPKVFMELEAVAACVMGGLSLAGGRGAVIGIVVGAIMFHLVQDVILLAGLPGFYLDLFVGLVIVFGVTLNQIAKKRY
jgi:simple sugar transport system permease protein